MQLTSLTDGEGTSPVPIIAVSTDSRDDSADLRKRLSSSHDVEDLILLEDVDHRVIDRYGLFNDEMWMPVAHPATFVLDSNGVVQWHFVETNYRTRADIDDVRRALAALDDDGE